MEPQAPAPRVLCPGAHLATATGPVSDPLVVPQRPNQVWSADFMSAALYQGSRFRLFNVNDDFNRESVTIEVDTSLRSERLGRVFERLKAEHELLDMLRVGNGPEFMGQFFRGRCQAYGVLIDYITVPGPAQSPYRHQFGCSAPA